MASASAIPPPDALISIWQSALQMLGVASVFIAGAYFSIKQFFSVYFSSWNRYTLLTALLGFTVPFMLWFYYGNGNSEQSVVFTPATTIEYISIEETIKRDPDKRVRKWKLKTLKEMKQEANYARSLKKLPNLSYQTLASFSPQTLHEELKNNRSKFYLLDVREAYERSKFSMQYDASVRYGDVLHGIITPELAKALPRDKQIVVLCHSGLRGYITSNLLAKLGYKNIAFLQGGIRNWSDNKLPVTGNEDYSADPVIKPVFTKEMIAKEKDVTLVNIEAGKPLPSNLTDVTYLPFETATSKDIKGLTERSKTKPLIIICSSFISCFHSNSFSYLVEKAGGKIMGIYDTTGVHVIAPLANDG